VHPAKNRVDQIPLQVQAAAIAPEDFQTLCLAIAGDSERDAHGSITEKMQAKLSVMPSCRAGYDGLTHTNRPPQNPGQFSNGDPRSH